MPIEMPKGLPFSVDTWTPQSEGKRHHFLTHAHRDHLAGISSRSAFPIYATRLTKSFALRYFPHIEESLFVEMEVGHSVVVRDPDGDFKVTAFDANHCPGAVMFLFEGEFGNILHTGDCRLTPECLHCLPDRYVTYNKKGLAKKRNITKKGKDKLSQLDYLFLDCTFGRCSLKIPSRQSAIQQVIKCIQNHPNAPVVYLACDMLGHEEILVQVSKKFRSKIYVDKINNSKCFHSLSLIAPEILTSDGACRFQVIEGFPTLALNEIASQKFVEARANRQVKPLFIRPSAQWFAINIHPDSKLSTAVKDEFGIWRVLYSIHSFQDELERALQLLQPRCVISTTPPCEAMELDYVKKYCDEASITSDDSSSDGCSDECFNCGRPGHWAPECPFADSGECFNCGRPGHWARECPFAGSRDSITSDDSSSDGCSDECFNCGRPGHWAPECPFAGSGECFNCGRPGHWAPECPYTGSKDRVKCRDNRSRRGGGATRDKRDNYKKRPGPYDRPGRGGRHSSSNRRK